MAGFLRCFVSSGNGSQVLFSGFACSVRPTIRYRRLLRLIDSPPRASHHLVFVLYVRTSNVQPEICSRLRSYVCKEPLSIPREREEKKRCFGRRSLYQKNSFRATMVSSLIRNEYRSRPFPSPFSDGRNESRRDSGTPLYRCGDAIRISLGRSAVRTRQSDILPNTLIRESNII